METIKLDLIPGKKMPSLHASQYDDGREHGIDLFENGVVYKLDGTETLTINERKGDDCICSLDIVNTFAESNHIVFASTEQMCAVWGNNLCELVIKRGSVTLGTLNFILEIESSPTEGGIESESEIKNLKRQIEEITEQVIGDDYYTAEETDEAIATAIEGKADTTYVDTELGKKADKSNTYTKSEVDTLIDNLPEPMIFKGTLGVGGTIQSLPTASASNEGWTYKVITDGTYAGQTAKVGDVFTSNGSAWVLIPSGDEDNDTWRAIKVEGVEVLGNGISSGAVDFVGSENIEVDFDGNGNKVGVKTKNIYTKEEVDDIVYNILPDDTASGSVANFITSLELPIKSLDVDVNAVQEAGTPTPETPLPISGWSEIKAVHTGKNLFDINRAQGTPIPSTLLESPRIMETNKWYKGIRADNYYYENYANCTIENNVLTVYTFNNVNYGVGFPISCKPNTTYILSAEQTGCNFSVGCYDKNWNFISRLLGVTTYVNPLSFTTPSNATYITIVIGSVVNGEGIARNIQLEIGSTSTDYEPYNGNEYIINLGGTCYGGHYTQDKDGHRQFEVTHGFIQYNGLSGQAWRRASNGVFYIDGFSGDVIPYKSSYYKCLSTRVSSTNGALGYPKYIVSQLISNNTRFMVYDADISSDTEFNSNLENKPLELVYELATPSGYMVAPLTEPIIIPLADGEPIVTLNGTNNIYADTGDTKVVFKCSVNDYVSAHSGGNLLGMGGVYLGGAKSGGGEEEPTDENEDTEKVKLDETKVEVKEIGDDPNIKKLGGE